ncbi:hypothetical protein BN439_1455 [Erwinia amylovora Ea644]|nr:hypothetical protein BN439_1455 [Erwinia amylovora Ea644]CCP06542.1 hypothetical protein BN440_1500 [Erwinia amylovora MR1]
MHRATTPHRPNSVILNVIKCTGFLTIILNPLHQFNRLRTSALRALHFFLHDKWQVND